MISQISPLLTDLYQLNMIQAYLDCGETKTAVFELFVRKLPSRRQFLMSAGLEQALEYLETTDFAPEEIEWLAKTGKFKKNFLDYLQSFRFTGDVYAMKEGTIFFANEPILRITAPLPQAQLVETRLINLLQYQTLVATKAARIMLAAPGKMLVDFGLRRAHGAEAGLLAARASYIAGFAGTATVLAERDFGIPSYGTMAHSYVQAHDSEAAAFEHFARSRPHKPTLLIDSYDTVKAAHKVVTLAKKLKQDGISIGAVRIDSGDMTNLSKQVRQILDAGGLTDVKIFVSGGLEEDSISAMVSAGAPIDGFGVGTTLTTSSDAPSLDCAYKLEEYGGRARRKRSAGKVTWPGSKQVFRKIAGNGRMAGDTLAALDEKADGEPLLHQVMAGGKRTSKPPTLKEIREHAARELDRLPPPLRKLDTTAYYNVTVSPALTKLADEVDRWLMKQDHVLHE